MTQTEYSELSRVQRITRINELVVM